MALLCCDTYLAVGASTNVFLVARKLKEGESSDHSTLEILSAVIEDSSARSRDEVSNDGQDEGGEKKKTKNDQSTSYSPQILAMGFSLSGRKLAACNNRKQLIVWRLGDSGWKQEKHWSLDKQATALSFSGTDGNGILVADRSGQVTEYNLEATESGGKILLGHLSILLDLCLSTSQRFLVTADRDEKIRASHYPKAHDIQAFCLGHTEYVRTVCLCPGLKEADGEEGILASGGGDGYVKLWRFTDGIELASFDLGQPTNESAASGDNSNRQSQRKRIKKLLCCQKSTSDSFQLAVAFEGAVHLLFLDIACSEDGSYSITNSVEWEPDQSLATMAIADICQIDSRVYVLLSGESGFNMAEIDVSSATPIRLPSSSAIDSLIKCKDLEKCMINAKEELPPMVKVVQFDNLGEYFERKKARIESRSK